MNEVTTSASTSLCVSPVWTSVKQVLTTLLSSPVHFACVGLIFSCVHISRARVNSLLFPCSCAYLTCVKITSLSLFLCLSHVREHPSFILVLVLISRAWTSLLYPCSCAYLTCVNIPPLSLCLYLSLVCEHPFFMFVLVLISRAWTSLLYPCSCTYLTCVNIPPLCLFLCLSRVRKYPFFILVLVLISRALNIPSLSLLLCLSHVREHPFFILVLEFLLISQVWTTLNYEVRRDSGIHRKQRNV